MRWSPAPNRPHESFVRKSHRLTEFEQLNDFFSHWNGRIEQVSCGRFSGRLTVVQGRVIRLVAIECNQSVVAHGAQEHGLLTVYPVRPTNAGGVWHGRRLAPGQIVVHGIEAHVDHLSARLFGTTGISASAVQMQEAARRLFGGVDVSLPDSWAAVTVPPDSFRAIERRLQRLLTDPWDELPAGGYGESEQLEQDCIRSVLAAVLEKASPRQTLAPPARTRLVRGADELMRSRLCAPLGVVDLCAALKASERTLRLAFRERFGVGTMTYYRILRLNAVRAILMADSAVGIAGAAHRFGFMHLGNFAADYRRQFGERPTETRARAACKRTRR